MKKWMIAVLTSVLVLSCLSGCAGLLVGGIATGAMVIHDRRTVGTVLEDQSIELKAKSALNKDKTLHAEAHLIVVSFNNRVLLAGETPNPALKQRAGNIVSGIEKVHHVFNEIKIAAPSSMGSRSSDTLVTAKVKAKLFSVKFENFDASRVKVVTVNGVVYLMGLVTREEGAAVTDPVRLVKGVERVVKLFEYIS